MDVKFTYSEGPYCTCLLCGALVDNDYVRMDPGTQTWIGGKDIHKAWHESLDRP